MGPTEAIGDDRGKTPPKKSDVNPFLYFVSESQLCIVNPEKTLPAFDLMTVSVGPFLSQNLWNVDTFHP